MTTEGTATANGLAGTAGGLLRAARERQGLHIAALAATVKVSTAKLEALEADRYDELPNITFTRALAKTLCRVLKLDEHEVLQRLPDAPTSRLEFGETTLNTPFHDRARASDPAQWLPWRRPLPWLVVALLVAAAVFVLVPFHVDLSQPSAGPSTDVPMGASPPVPGASEADAGQAAAPLAGPAASAAVPAQAGASAVPAAAASGAAPAPAADLRADGPLTVTPAASGPQAAEAEDVAVLRAVQDTWVQATDGGGQVLMARLVPAGETVELSGQLPLRLRVGNIAGTELRFRGKPVPLQSPRRDNVANLVLPADAEGRPGSSAGAPAGVPAGASSAGPGARPAPVGAAAASAVRMPAGPAGSAPAVRRPAPGAAGRASTASSAVPADAATAVNPAPSARP